MAKTTKAKRPVGNPAERAAQLQAQSDKVRRRYKVNVTKRKKFTFEGEEELVKNMIVVLKLANYSNVQIAMIVGVSRKQVSVFLEDGNVQKQYMRLKERLPQAALELGRMYLIEAVGAVVTVMRTTDDESMILKAASELFDRFGIPKSSRVESSFDGDPSEDNNPLSDKTLMERIRSAAPETQEAVAQLQEAWVEGVEQLLSAKETTDADSA